MSDRRNVIPAKAGIALVVLSLGVAAAAPSGDELLELADAPKRAFAEAVIHARVSVVEKGVAAVPAEFDLYKKGENRALVVFTAGKQKGRKVLTVGDRFWILVPGASRPIPVTPNQRLVGGAALGDVAKLQFAREFRATKVAETETIGGATCDVLELAAKSPRSAYGSGRIWIGRGDHLARKAVLNLVSGKPAKEIDFDRYGKENGKTVLLAMTIRDLLSPVPSETRLEYSNYRVLKIDDSFFTPEGALKF